MQSILSDSSTPKAWIFIVKPANDSDDVKDELGPNLNHIKASKTACRVDGGKRTLYVVAK